MRRAPIFVRRRERVGGTSMAPKANKRKVVENHCSAGTTHLIGRPVEKEFKGFGTFHGWVADFHVTTGYRVEYEDGDSEDFSEASLLEILSKVPAPFVELEAVSQMTKRSAPPSLSLYEFKTSAKSAARRKIKHTHMKRSGMFERKQAMLQAQAEARAAAEAAKTPLAPPPAWAEGLDREAKVIRCDGVPDVETAMHDSDISLFRLRLAEPTATSVSVQWWFPPATPGMSCAWIGLFHEDGVVWGANGSPYGEVASGGGKDEVDKLRILYRLITKDATSGVSKFSNFTKTLQDGVYCFTLQADYGRYCRAVSEKFKVSNGRITAVYEGNALCSDFPLMNRKHRQQNAALNLLQDIRRSKDEDAEEQDERAYFPLTNIDVTLPDKYQESMPLIKRIYGVCDKLSFLDWGLTSDYKIGDEENAEARVFRERKAAELKEKPKNEVAVKITSQYSDLPSAAQFAARKIGINGSEGYGEATVGSAHKIGLVLTHLRHLVLQDLHDTHWGLLWDLGPHSTFLDIGSGYGKVVMHLRAVARMRLAVGVECVESRDTIAKQALFQLEAEVFDNPSMAGAVPSASASEATASNSRPGSAASETAIDAPRVVPQKPLDGVEFQCLEINSSNTAELAYTHIYMFDWVFAKSTLADLAKVLQRSPFYVLLSFRKPTEWWSYGLNKIQPVAKVPGFRTTGGEGMTCYFYVNVEKLPAQ